MARGLTLSAASVALSAMVALAACGFTGPGAAPLDGSGDGGGGDGPGAGSEGGADATADNDVPLPDADPLPSHLPDFAYDDAAADLSGVTSIDTGTPGAGSPIATPPLPPGVHFEVKGSDQIAVLVVGTWTVNAPIVVTGARSLIVVASRGVLVQASIDAGGKAEKPGPGGFAFGSGDGRGKDGAVGSGNQDSDGGGGSFGSLGAAGASTTSGKPGGDPGPLYGADPKVFLGGSPGGEGSPVGDCRTRGVGGGGGGAIQISAQLSLEIASGAWINVGGGGGRGGCSSAGKAGGGGGSGGTIFLESQSLVVAGTLAANGGGGGAGGSGDLFDDFNGESGENAGASLPIIDVALGGTDPAQGKGGNGAVEGTPPVKPATAGGENNQGGGGGGMGRIWLRTFGAKGVAAKPADTAGAKISPAPATAP